MCYYALRRSHLADAGYSPAMESKMVALLVIAVITLLYMLATSKSRNAVDAPDWVTPGNGYGRHGAHGSKKF